MFNAPLTTFGIDVDLPHHGVTKHPQTPQKSIHVGGLTQCCSGDTQPAQNVPIWHPEVWNYGFGGPKLRGDAGQERKSTRLNSSHGYISYAVFCLKKKKKNNV